MLTIEELNDRLIDLAFSEDIGDGDHTTLCCIPDDAIGESKLLIKQEGIFAGVEIAKRSVPALRFVIGSGGLCERWCACSSR